MKRSIAYCVSPTSPSGTSTSATKSSRGTEANGNQAFYTSERQRLRFWAGVQASTTSLALPCGRARTEPPTLAAAHVEDVDRAVLLRGSSTKL
jgi:hypothetical protein